MCVWGDVWNLYFLKIRWQNIYANKKVVQAVQSHNGLHCQSGSWTTCKWKKILTGTKNGVCLPTRDWFASVETALAGRKELRMEFMGPIKTSTVDLETALAHKYFSIEHLRLTLTEMRRGDHVVFKWHDPQSLQVLHYHSWDNKSWETCRQKKAR